MPKGVRNPARADDWEAVGEHKVTERGFVAWLRLNRSAPWRAMTFGRSAREARLALLDQQLPRTDDTEIVLLPFGVEPSQSINYQTGAE